MRKKRGTGEKNPTNRKEKFAAHLFWNRGERKKRPTTRKKKARDGGGGRGGKNPLS